MITKAEKRRIKKVIGHRYVNIIQDELNQCNQFNKSGEPYSASQITNVVNGVPHIVIEDAIYRVLRRQIQITEERKMLLAS